ncbi:MAG TPA: aspartate/glutamate racemase family protein [Candidatus Sulfotelmatobacter sp.]|jgi:glutamate racemase|nr:aspartate/glutamate racemase family protein [Candidatus Sulfotelmatobacter sp.]
MIGVFDSGHGGLTILQALARRLPERRFVYLGDHANAPYGDRSADEIYGMTVTAIDRLFGQGCRLVILACNTAAMSLRRIQQNWLAEAYPDRRVLGVVVPMIEVVTGLPWMADPKTSPSPRPRATVAVFATRRTAEADVYPQEIAKRAPQVTVEMMACPRLAALIEQGAPREELRHFVQRYVAELTDRLNGRPLDAALLGCTHYPLVEDLFRDALPPGVELLAQPIPTADSLAAYLERHPDLDRPNSGGVTFHTTGDPERISAMASAFYGGETRFIGMKRI